MNSFLRVCRAALAGLTLVGCGTNGVPAAADAAVGDAAPPVADASPVGCLLLPTWELPAPKASLPVTPSVLWRRKVAENPGSMSIGVTGFLVRSGDQLAFAYNGQLRVVDREGKPLWQTDYSDLHGAIGGVNADSDGNYYQFADKLYSYTPTGEKRWATAFPNMGLGGDQFAPTPLIRGNTDLFVGTSEGLLRRIAAKTGATIWQRDQVIGAMNLVAAGNLLQNALGGTWDPETGTTRQLTVDGVAGFLVAARANELWVGLQEPNGLHMTATDSCFRPLRTRSPRALVAAGVVDLDGKFWETTRLGSGTAFRTLTVDGADSDTLGAAGWPQLVGADNVTYGVTFSAGGAQEHTSELTIRGSKATSLQLGGWITGTFTLGEDGIMHALTLAPDGVFLNAIQTTSPGVADTPLPMALSDNRRSGWPKEH